ncbi:MAG: hypothetical protein ACK4X1_00385 [Terricaulis sp.]
MSYDEAAPPPQAQTGDLFCEAHDPAARWRVVDYWRDVVILVREGADRAKRHLYQSELTEHYLPVRSITIRTGG